MVATVSQPREDVLHSSSAISACELRCARRTACLQRAGSCARDLHAAALRVAATRVDGSALNICPH